MNYFRQIYYEMKHQKMMTWVSVSGTALAIFLVMSFIVADRINTVEVTPETHRNRILLGEGIHIKMDGHDGSTMGLNSDFIKKIYEGLEGVEVISYIRNGNSNSTVSVPGEEGMTFLPKSIDANFWKIYDFNFIDGRPFNQGEAEADSKVAVLTRSAARKLFGEEKVSGRTIEVNMIDYHVIGVVDDVHPLMNGTFAHFYIPFNAAAHNWDNDPFSGGSNVRLLLKEGVDVNSVKREVEQRYQRLNGEHSKDGTEFIYHDQPYTSQEEGMSFGSNNGPDLKTHNRVQWVVYAILILLPAINLSSMTRGRLRHRVAEIGVRRAFGAKRKSIVWQLFGENFIITLIGGVIGLVLSAAFIMLASHLFFKYYGGLEASSLDLIYARPSFEMMFSWVNFLICLGFCLVLNILSATIPAWRASRVEPAIALSGR